MIRAAACYVRAWLCYWIVMTIPGHRWRWAYRVTLAVAPYAGDYAYWNWRDRLTHTKETDHAPE